MKKYEMKPQDLEIMSSENLSTMGWHKKFLGLTHFKLGMFYLAAVALLYVEPVLLVGVSDLGIVVFTVLLSMYSVMLPQNIMKLRLRADCLKQEKDPYFEIPRAFGQLLFPSLVAMLIYSLLTIIALTSVESIGLGCVSLLLSWVFLKDCSKTPNDRNGKGWLLKFGYNAFTNEANWDGKLSIFVTMTNLVLFGIFGLIAIPMSVNTLMTTLEYASLSMTLHSIFTHTAFALRLISAVNFACTPTPAYYFYTRQTGNGSEYRLMTHEQALGVPGGKKFSMVDQDSSI